MLNLIIENIYHETRHVEQRFRALCIMAEQIMSELCNKKNEESTGKYVTHNDVADEMIKRKYLPKERYDIALQAAKTQLSIDWTFRDEGNLWAWSSYKYEKYSDFVQNTLHGTSSDIQDASSALNENNKTKWPEHIQKMNANLKTCAKGMNEALQAITKQKSDQDSQEEKKLQTKMESELDDLKVVIEVLQEGIEVKEIDIAEIKLDAKTLVDQWNGMYMDLPEEADAHAAGYAVRDAFNNSIDNEK